ncbi:MAG: heparinase II/III family protein [Candidatus Omnitrophica bacterium]|nr:heparinase II/III family protein [Candidatus Omnitrophota bacterium]
MTGYTDRTELTLLKKGISVLYACALLFFYFGAISTAFCLEVKSTHPRLVDIASLKKTQDKRNLNLLKRKGIYYLPADEEMLIERGNEKTFIRLYSLLYALEGTERYLEKAKRLVEALINAPETKDDQHIRNRLQALSYYYDLCFETLNVDNKRKVEGEILRHIKRLDEYRLLRTDRFAGGHHHYANITALMGSLAVYYEQPSVQETVKLLENNLKQEFQPFYRYLAGEDGGFHMWWEYSRYYILSQLEFCAIWKNATGEDLFKTNKWIDKTFYFLLYGLRDDLTYWATGDNHSWTTKSTDRMAFRKIAAEYDNGYAQYMAIRLARSKWPKSVELFFNLLWEDKSVEAKPIKDLPLVKEFKKVGVYVFREGWKGESVTALFKCTPIYFFNHSHRDANSFEVWYRENLAIDSGYYDEYGSEHWWNYYIRSIAHNTVLIYDPAEEFTVRGRKFSNDGGQRFIEKPQDQPFNVKDLEKDAFRTGETEMLENNDYYTLVSGDATRAYSDNKCELFKRYFLWLKRVRNWKHPVIVVFDRVISTKPEFEKVWMLHTQNKPKIKDNLISVFNKRGKMWCYVIQPHEFEINLAGGKGHEFEADGKNYELCLRRTKRIMERAGSWRIELKEKTPHKETRFLNVLIPTERFSLTAPEVKATEDGVRIENWHVSFSDGVLKVVQG